LNILGYGRTAGYSSQERGSSEDEPPYTLYEITIRNH
jgi:hypothetical protein